MKQYLAQYIITDFFKRYYRKQNRKYKIEYILISAGQENDIGDEVGFRFICSINLFNFSGSFMCFYFFHLSSYIRNL